MSALHAFTHGWGFRTSTPSFQVGEELSLYVTGYDSERGVALARVGDTILEVSGAGAEDIDQRINARVTEFDERRHRGHVERVTG